MESTTTSKESFFSTSTDGALRLSQLAALHQPDAIARAMQLDKAIAHGGINQEVTYELHA